MNIARALALEPRLVILDEAVAALDKSVEAQVLNLLSDLKESLNLTYLFISHDLNVVEYMSDRVMVMYLGRVVETGPVESIYRHPRHPYTRALFASKPTLDPDRRTTEMPLTGDPPNPINPPSGCRFRTRCAFAQPRCAGNGAAAGRAVRRRRPTPTASGRLPSSPRPRRAMRRCTMPDGTIRAAPGPAGRGPDGPLQAPQHRRRRGERRRFLAAAPARR